MSEIDPAPDPTAVLHAYAAAIDAQDWPGLRALLVDTFTSTLVRTGETLSADAYVAFNRDYPGSWRFRLHDVVAGDGRVAGRARVHDGAEVHHVALFAEVADGLLTRLDEVWTEDTTSTTAPPTTGPPTTAPPPPEESPDE